MSRAARRKPPRRRANANEVRIVGGEWRSRRIRFSSGADLRPTPDRVRETLFNWLGQDLTGLTCLDLFAGSGALGFEAASRGAAHVVMVEHDRAAHAALLANREALDARRVEVVRRDALEFVRGDGGNYASDMYDVIFLDPPYAAGYWPQLVSLLPARMKPEARVYYEADEPPEWPAAWNVLKQSRAGRVVFQLVTRIHSS